jgi:hypothetical protein
VRECAAEPLKQRRVQEEPRRDDEEPAHFSFIRTVRLRRRQARTEERRRKSCGELMARLA